MPVPSLPSVGGTTDNRGAAVGTTGGERPQRTESAPAAATVSGSLSR